MQGRDCSPTTGDSRRGLQLALNLACPGSRRGLHDGRYNREDCKSEETEDCNSEDCNSKDCNRGQQDEEGQVGCSYALAESGGGAGEGLNRGGPPLNIGGASRLQLRAGRSSSQQL